jgi:hypothetical protein
MQFGKSFIMIVLINLLFLMYLKVYQLYISFAAKYSGLDDKYDKYFDKFMDKFAFMKVNLQFYSQGKL